MYKSEKSKKMSQDDICITISESIWSTVEQENGDLQEIKDNCLHALLALVGSFIFVLIVKLIRIDNYMLRY